VDDRVLRLTVDALERQEGVLTREQALGAGFSRHVINGRVASGQWQRLHTGVFATFSGPVPRAARLWGAVLRAGDDAVLSHHTAAEVWNLTDQSSSSIHVSVPRQAGSLDIRGLVLHYSSRLPGARHPARLPPQTTLEETVLDLADVSRTAEVRAGVHSPLELRYLRDVERRHGLPRGDRQAVTIRRGTRQYADVRYTEYSVLVELDGVLAHPAEARKHDSRRDNANTLDGFQTLRYGWVPVAYHACAVAREVADLLRKRGWRGFLRRCGNACPVTMSAESRSLVRSGR
jgi:hypothetical protein